MKNIVSIICFLFVLMASFDLLQSAAVGDLDNNGIATNGKSMCCGGCVFGYNPICGCPCVGDVSVCCQYKM
jgi:hypothetical protein